MKFFILTRERSNEGDVVTDLFMADDSISNPEDTLRKAVHDYLLTDDGKDSIVINCSNFSWRDAIMAIPNKHYQKYGLRLIKKHIASVNVKQNEILFSELQESVQA